MALSFPSPAYSPGSHLMDVSFLHPDKVDWTPRTFLVEVYDGVDEKVPYEVDLLDYISKIPHPTYQGNIANDNRLYLDPSAHVKEVTTDEEGNTVKKHSTIANILNNQSCLNSGYKLMVTSTNKKNPTYRRYRL